MRFPPHFLDELRARLPVSEVVGRRVKLKKAGREWKGLSPFQQEKTPSFTVNDQKGFYHDFSSGRHGDIFGFVMETEGVTFAEAVERLAAMAGLSVPQSSPQDEAREQRRKTLHDVMDLAATFFTQTLASRAGAKARGYLADRGMDAGVQVKFRLGYAPSERFALKEFLGGHGISVDDMIEAGLLISGDDIPVPFDRFRDRVMFPIADARGRIIAFGGRALEKDVPAKYLNSPETPLFHKGDTLYNIATARQAVHDGATLIAVEGYVDVIAMSRVGFAATVAPLGTALTENQLALLWKMADEPTLCFDGDKAGQRAAYRAADLALPLLKPGKSLRFALLPEGQDPDDLVRSGGRAAIEEVLALARPLADLVWMRETESGSYATPERRAALEARINELANVVQDEVVRKYYRQDLLGRLRAMFQPAMFQPAAVPNHLYGARGAQGYVQPGQRGGVGQKRGSFGGGRGAGLAGGAGLRAASGFGRAYQAASPQMASSPLMRGQQSALSPREAHIAVILLNHPWLLHDHVEEVAELGLVHADARQLVEAIISAFSHDPHTDDLDAARTRLRKLLVDKGFSEVMQRVERALTAQSVWGVRADAGREDVNLTWHQLVSLHHQRNSLTKELKSAELALGTDPTEANYAWLRDVQSRLSVVDGLEALVEGFGVSSGRPASGM